jgi:NAD(P)-dependent dehydrogenase (short-subunit alcohol dehydrogenase family)
VERFGCIDVLFNNAGTAIRHTVGDQDEAGWQRVLAVNVKGAFLCSKYALPHFGERGGSIIHSSSVTGITGVRNRAAYSAAKGALVALARNMALDYAGRRIRVNCICPGPMYTPMVYASGNGMSDAARAQRVKASLLKTEGTGWDVGHAVKFLLSNYARYITGQVLVVDGGVTLQGPERDSQDR